MSSNGLTISEYVARNALNRLSLEWLEWHESLEGDLDSKKSRIYSQIADKDKDQAFLNALHTEGLAKLEAIEAWWVERVRDYFAAKPFKLRYDTSKSLRAIVRNLLDQAWARQAENPGTMYLGTVLQHLVGAKLALVFPDMDLAHHGVSVADEPTARAGDFIINDVAIHVTSAPGELLIDKCAQNLSSGTTPLIITLKERAVVAEALAEMRGIGERVEIFDAEQFLATNLHELSRFSVSQRRITIDKLVQKYNQIVDACETDPSLRIQS